MALPRDRQGFDFLRPLRGEFPEGPDPPHNEPDGASLGPSPFFPL